MKTACVVAICGEFAAETASKTVARTSGGQTSVGVPAPPKLQLKPELRKNFSSGDKESSNGSYLCLFVEDASKLSTRRLGLGNRGDDVLLQHRYILLFASYSLLHNLLFCLIS